MFDFLRNKNDSLYRCTVHLDVKVLYSPTDHNDVFLPNIFNNLTLARPKYELPDDGHRPKHVGEF